MSCKMKMWPNSRTTLLQRKKWTHRNPGRIYESSWIYVQNQNSGLRQPIRLQVGMTEIWRKMNNCCVESACFFKIKVCDQTGTTLFALTETDAYKKTAYEKQTEDVDGGRALGRFCILTSLSSLKFSAELRFKKPSIAPLTSQLSY